MRPSLEYHLPLKHFYHLELNMMIINKRLVRCFALSAHYLFFVFFFVFSIIIVLLVL